uniref:Uncharacterized protein n=1 Tax=Knipowitschia caucasica TaxID=637954 RepID=A0AAV2L3I6_KNICA
MRKASVCIVRSLPLHSFISCRAEGGLCSDHREGKSGERAVRFAGAGSEAAHVTERKVRDKVSTGDAEAVSEHELSRRNIHAASLLHPQLSSRIVAIFPCLLLQFSYWLISLETRAQALIKYLTEVSPSFHDKLDTNKMRLLPTHWSECRSMLLLCLIQMPVSFALPFNSSLEQMLDKYMDEDGEVWKAKQRGKRAIRDSDAQLILDLHNKLRGQVYPQASNMEYMCVRRGERSAEVLSQRHKAPSLSPVTAGWLL